MRVALMAEQHHRRQFQPVLEALQYAGHELVPNPPADVLLAETDVPLFGCREYIDQYADLGTVVLQYPHGAAPDVQYDGTYEPYDRVDGSLLLSDGNAELWRRLGIARPTRTIGWFYCEQRSFRPRDEIVNVLFAPIHPNGDGSILPAHEAANAAVFNRLLATPWRITVRFLDDSPVRSGIPLVPDVGYLRGEMDNSTLEIDQADVVVAGIGTFPALAVARGVPAVTYGQNLLGVLGTKDDVPSRPTRRDLYEDLVRYPFDADDGPLERIVRAAASDSASVSNWRRWWIGNQLDPTIAPGVIEQFVLELRRVSALT